MHSSRKIMTTGIVVLTIGISLLVGTIYRSNSTYDFGYLGTMGLEPKTWSFGNQTNLVSNLTPYLWPPCNLDLSIQTNSTIDVHILDEKGITLWESEHTLKPIWSTTGITGDTVTIHIPHRGFYYFLVYNPGSSTIIYKIDATLYGFETDLLVASALSIGIGTFTIELYWILHFLSKKKEKNRLEGTSDLARNESRK